MENREQNKAWARRIADQIAEKVIVTVARNRGKIPYTTVNGRFDDWSGERIGWWTNGFWPAQLWQMYHAYGNEEFRAAAEEAEEKLDAVLKEFLPMDHDAGFRFLISAVADYRITGNKESRNRGVLAASNLAGRFNLAANLIRAWNDAGTGETAGLAIIDCMMNLPLLYWASDELHDPRFRQIAMAHADRVREVFVREDGSVHHIVEFDPETGKIVGPKGGQGMQIGSSWTRGQSWALYGFTLSYVHTGTEAYLETAEKIADYVISRIPASGIIPVDFDQPEEIPWEDASAAAILASGFLELEKFAAGSRKEAYYDTAVFLLRTLAEKRCNWEKEADSIVENCSAAYHDDNHNFAMIYGDYYFTEAILKLAEKGIMLW
ncbi:MAG: glycoside hydrolase family 88 protein [bacterium]|nr:glycoside hydrolase family 88 protein [bacterium]